MNKKQMAYCYLGGIVALSLLAANPEPEASGSPIGWMFYGSIMTALIYGLIRAISYIDPEWEPQRRSRSHYNDRCTR